METKQKTVITVETNINAPVEKVWDCWNKPEHITKWAFASDDWHAPKASNDLKVDGTFSTTMAAKDGSMSFEFGGVYTEVKKHEKIAYTMGDGRRAEILFSAEGNTTHINEQFEAEGSNPVDMQKAGWQAILDNFKKYVESVK